MLATTSQHLVKCIHVFARAVNPHYVAFISSSLVLRLPRWLCLRSYHIGCDSSMCAQFTLVCCSVVHMCCATLASEQLQAVQGLVVMCDRTSPVSVVPGSSNRLHRHVKTLKRMNILGRFVQMNGERSEVACFFVFMY